MAVRFSLLAILLFVGCSSPKVERIAEDTLSKESKNTQEVSQEVPMPKLKLQDIPPTPQEQIIELQ